MNRSLLIGAAVIFFVATVGGFALNAPIAGWICLVIGVLLLIASFTRSNTNLQSAAPSDLGGVNNQILLTPTQGIVNSASPLLGGTGSVNPEIPVNAGPPHIPESREDPFDNHGPLGNSY